VKFIQYCNLGAKKFFKVQGWSLKVIRTRGRNAGGNWVRECAGIAGHVAQLAGRGANAV